MRRREGAGTRHGGQGQGARAMAWVANAEFGVELIGTKSYSRCLVVWFVGS
jgi:hypothetical protein